MIQTDRGHTLYTTSISSHCLYYALCIFVTDKLSVCHYESISSCSNMKCYKSYATTAHVQLDCIQSLFDKISPSVDVSLSVAMHQVIVIGSGMLIYFFSLLF